VSAPLQDCQGLCLALFQGEQSGGCRGYTADRKPGRWQQDTDQHRTTSQYLNTHNFVRVQPTSCLQNETSGVVTSAHVTHITRTRPCGIKKAFPPSKKIPLGITLRPKTNLRKEHPRPKTTQGIQKNIPQSQKQPRAYKKKHSQSQNATKGIQQKHSPVPQVTKGIQKNIPPSQIQPRASKQNTLPVQKTTLGVTEMSPLS